MLRFCVYQWDLNKSTLQEHIERDIRINSCDYDYLVKLVVHYILNGEHRHPELRYWSWSEEIDKLDHGCYQGVAMYVVHRNNTDDASGYIITSVRYGSCSVCDTLESIQCCSADDELPTEQQVKDYMALCKDIVCGFVHPFPNYFGEGEGWQHMTIKNHTEVER